MLFWWHAAYICMDAPSECRDLKIRYRKARATGRFRFLSGEFIWDTPQTNGQAQDMSSVRLWVTTSPSCRAPPPLTARVPQVVFLLFTSMVSLFRYLGTREALAQAWSSGLTSEEEED